MLYFAAIHGLRLNSICNLLYRGALYAFPTETLPQCTFAFCYNLK